LKRLQAFKYELMPTGDQQRQMRRFAGSCRFVFNKALALQKGRNGGWLIAIPPQNTSRTCPCCGHVSADNRRM
jgi:transposase